MSKTLDKLFDTAKKKYPRLTCENFYRIMLLYSGVKYGSRDSFSDPLARSEVMFQPDMITSIPLLIHFRPGSPFSFQEGGANGRIILLYGSEFVDTVKIIEITTFDMRQTEPFYFFVREINGNLVMKLNPRQLCDFFRNSDGNIPCSFCFRNDLIKRFRNISGARLVNLILNHEKGNGYSILKMTDEISLITGSYRNDEEYIKEVSVIVRGLRKHVSGDCRIVVGSHEGKGKENFMKLKKAGVTDFTMSVESFDNRVRLDQMQNRKGVVKIEDILDNVETAISIFGEDHVIIRVIAGMGDRLDEEFRQIIKRITVMGKRKKGPFWNVNIYMPFTHYAWRKFSEKPFFGPEYLFEYFSILNEYIDQDRFYRFKISP